MKLFCKEINPYNVSCRVRFRNIDRTIVLSVKAQASTLVLGIKRANDKMVKLDDQSSDADRLESARFFAEVIFGKEQAEKLVSFYNDDALAVLNACGMFFSQKLAKLITKAQKNK